MVAQVQTNDYCRGGAFLPRFLLSTGSGNYPPPANKSLVNGSGAGYKPVFSAPNFTGLGSSAEHQVGAGVWLRSYWAVRLAKVIEFEFMRRLFKILAKTVVAALLAGSLAACGGGDKKLARSLDEDVTSALGVNGYLWRAALDTLSFMPMAQVDSAGGVIISDWYINPDVPEERLKVTVYILDRALRADGLRVEVFRQEYSMGSWANASVKAGTALQIEDAILTRARQLRIEVVGD